MTVPPLQVHDTWLSLDPVIGCPADCAYCYLGAINQRARRPHERLSPQQAWEALSRHSAYVNTQMPVAIGNYTDMLMTPANRAFFKQFLRIWESESDGRTLCVVTKARLTPRIVEDVLEAGGDGVMVFLSQSFASTQEVPIERGAVSMFEDSLAGARALRGHSNASPILFWRPFIGAFNPVDSIEPRIERIAEAGVAAAVVVGHKRLSGRSSVDARMMRLVHDPVDKTTDSGDEDFFELGFEYAKQAANRYDFPLYRNTSCAISYLRAQPDLIGTFASPVAASRCLPANCPASQRTICSAEGRGRELPSLRRMAEVTSLDPSQLHVVDGKLVVDGVVGEAAYSMLCHMTGSHVRATRVTGEKAWMGSSSGYQDLTAYREISRESPAEWFADNPQILQHAERLRLITGFATCYSSGDGRFDVFNRYEHIQRVAWIARRICGEDEELNRATQRYVWLHDLNRWAFAHNSEKGLYSQVENVPKFFAEIAGVAALEVDELVDFHRKDVAHRSIAVQCALVADMLAGLTEDPLMLLAGLNVSSAVFSGFRSPVLNSYVETAHAELIERAAYALHREGNALAFRHAFSTVYASVAESTWQRLSDGRTLLEALERGRGEAGDFKQTVLVPRVFPVNNNVVSRSPEIKALVASMIERLGYDGVNEMLLATNDRDFATLPTLGAGPETIRAQIQPRLDLAARELGVPPLVS